MAPWVTYNTELEGYYELLIWYWMDHDLKNISELLNKILVETV